MSTMQRATHLKYADASSVETLVLNTQPKPVLSTDTQVLIKIKSISINPIDYKLIGIEQMKGMDPRPLPRGVGSDFSGVVEAVGSSVTRMKVGDAVFGDGLGGEVIAEYLVIESAIVAQKPSNLSFNEAAGVALASSTALQVLRNAGEVKAGSKVCIFGGSGGVGIAAIQIAKALGASEIVTTSTATDLCKSLGADSVINYRDEDVGEKLKGQNFDVVFDAVGDEAHWEAGKKIMNPDTGKYLTIAGAFSKDEKGYQFVLKKPDGPDLDQLKDWIEKGTLKVVNDGTPEPFTQEGLSNLFKKQQSGKSKGKNIMEVSV